MQQKRCTFLSDNEDEVVSLVAVDGILFEYYSLLFKALSHFVQTNASKKTLTDVDSSLEMRKEFERLASQLSDGDNPVHKCQIIDILSIIPSAAQSKTSFGRVLQLSWDSLCAQMPVNPDLVPKFAKKSATFLTHGNFPMHSSVSTLRYSMRSHLQSIILQRKQRVRLQSPLSAELPVFHPGLYRVVLCFDAVHGLGV